MAGAVGNPDQTHPSNSVTHTCCPKQFQHLVAQRPCFVLCVWAAGLPSQYPFSALSLLPVWAGPKGCTFFRGCLCFHVVPPPSAGPGMRGPTIRGTDRSPWYSYLWTGLSTVGGMVGDQGEVLSCQVVSQFLDGLLYYEGFLFHCGVLPFTGG